MKVHTEKVIEQESKSVVIRQSSPSLEQRPEGETWNLFRNGDESAFHFIYLKYFPILFNYGYQFTADTDLVKDAIQDLFIYLREKRNTIGPTDSIKFYLYRAFRRRVIQYIDKDKSRGETLDFNKNYGFEIALSQESKLINTVVDEEQKRQLESAFATLTKRQKEIITYYFYDGFSYKEISQLMGFSKTQYARILVSRSIQKLRKEMNVVGLGCLLVILALLKG